MRKRWPENRIRTILVTVSESPYRSAVSQTQLEAETQIGVVRLVVAPQHTRLEVGSQIWTVANDHLTIITPTKRRPKKKSLLLRGARLYVARGWPTNETGLWLEQRTGVVRRLLGLPPLAGISQETMSTWHDLERLTSRLAEALAPYSANTSSFELGSGQHRVFVLKDSDGLSVFARPVFREKPRRVISVELDGTLLVPRRHRSDREISMEEGVEVIASGDRILFCHPDGEQVHGIFLPWIGAADRKELTRRLQALVGSRSEGERVIGKDEGNLNATLSQLLPS